MSAFDHPAPICTTLEKYVFEYDSRDEYNDICIFARFNEDEADAVKRIFFQKDDEAKESGLICMWTNWVDDYSEPRYSEAAEGWWTEFMDKFAA